LIHDYGVILCAISAIGKFQPPAYGEGVKENEITTKLKSTGELSIPPVAKLWRVMVSDNFDFMDEDEPASCGGSYLTYEEALARAKGIVEASIQNSQGITPDEIYDHYMSFGDDAFILAPAGTMQPEPLFSSWNYAEELAGKVAK
jgi:hypothetical protein